jgi:hypothetical protein
MMIGAVNLAVILVIGTHTFGRRRSASYIMSMNIAVATLYGAAVSSAPSRCSLSDATLPPIIG